MLETTAVITLDTIQRVKNFVEIVTKDDSLVVKRFVNDMKGFEKI